MVQFCHCKLLSRQSKHFQKLSGCPFIRRFCSSSGGAKGIRETIEFRDGKKLSFETGVYATMADGSALVNLGHTSVLVTAVSKQQADTSPGFVPLTVDYRQKYASVGHIPRNFLRRELAPTEKEILTGRAIDRSIRPLFPSGFSANTQVSCQLMAVDGLHDPDVVSINAASVALALSDIPWNGPVAAVRVGYIDGEVVIFPTRKELSESKLNLIVTSLAGNKIVMLEGTGSPILLPQLKQSIKTAAKECGNILKVIESLRKKSGKPKRKLVQVNAIPEELLLTTRKLVTARLRDILTDGSHNKLSRDITINKLRMDICNKLCKSMPEHDSSVTNEAFNIITKEVFRNLILEEDIRCDGRGLSDIRYIDCGINLFEGLHGSSLFRRGQTQVQCTVAYDSPDRALIDDPLLQATGGGGAKNFLLHYTFPAFANNEVGKSGPVSRREIGHGALAARALTPLLPKDFPFSVLLMATVLESNGSSSMATVCGGSLALMDAGVELAQPAAGVAIGLVTKQNQDTGQIESYKILTDILGIEDYLGDMDFKIAGTKSAITALQADIKLAGVPLEIIMKALDKSVPARNHILKLMHAVIAKPNENKSRHPVIKTKEIVQSKRSSIIGVGGLTMKQIQLETGAQLTWKDNSTLSIFAPNKVSFEEALQKIEKLLQKEPELEFGVIYNATIVEIRPQGVMVTLYDNMTPVLIHNSQLDIRRVNHPSVLQLEVDGRIKVKYFGRDPVSGRMRLSRRALQPPNLGVQNLHTEIQ